MPYCEICKHAVSHLPAPIFTADIARHKETWTHLAETAEEARELDADHEVELKNG